ncbi:Putative homoserine kinase type II (Protein kinase fold) OS=Singulisphaera acidiphila (strain ATCC BAA-1392 / DSM 18658 / VKM B-2454 / MOB10) GN=Sinac_2251 PE=4 SV=1: APH [Gemmata massiliana]|uniref:Aminoglycoside phosphotransferase domain-containing protein n=1 Tax=Gemmata massiliana TaxID=1210884 RepID=A0A6P2CS42_9BACT|nr:aminoglycoside phosphotransferase family protein [Gemmata massiliana]VTR91731.1 Putative homoserine kinase type II (Protein kinase fold) OS=Singulisphaera acidiphila (strain ATCC BAA-1392 / DSM 18658 / VKM B-2454 / MOB10) GN=Sinac_2251 PE=4 SV=1: APH [Gemmata massiliana]
MNQFLARPPRAVTEHFSPLAAELTWHQASEGFSGAIVWRGDDATGVPLVALKGWPPDASAERVQQIHYWMSQAARLPFVPSVFAGTHGHTAVFADGRLWDACRWVPGAPLIQPTEANIRSACEAVAHLHRCWPLASNRKPCRGVANRIDVLTAHRRQLSDWNRDTPPVEPALDPLLRRAVSVVARNTDAAITALRPWASRPLLSRPCLRDLRGEHIFFRTGMVTGVIDFGAMIIDHPAIDLARFLGDFSALRESVFSEGLNAYRACGGVLDVPDEFVQLLARTGFVCSLLGWLVRLVVRHEPTVRATAIAARLAHLLACAERITHF